MQKGKMFFCTGQALSNSPFYRAKMPSIATPVVHGNRPTGRMPHNFMTALGGRGEAQSALLAFGGRIRVFLAFGGHETGPAVYRRLFTRSGYACDRLACNLKAPAAASRCEHAARNFRSTNVGVAVGAYDVARPLRGLRTVWKKTLKLIKSQFIRTKLQL